METIILAAMTPSRVIGQNNTIPWNIPSEQHYFKEVTMGHTVIMGRKTWESIDSSLPGRRKIIITSSDLDLNCDCLQATSLPHALKLCTNDTSKAFIIGGARLYEEALPLADTLLLTIIHKEFQGDVCFPEIPFENFALLKEVSKIDVLPYTMYTYRRIEHNEP